MSPTERLSMRCRAASLCRPAQLGNLHSTFPLLLLVAFLLAGCSAGQMDVQPRCDPLEPSALFDDGRCSRLLIPETVARGQLQDDTLLYTGREPGQASGETGATDEQASGETGATDEQASGETGTTDEQASGEGSDANNQPLSTVFPMPVTRDVLERGQQRFNIYCAPCHGRDGEGDGMVVRRGFPSPPSLHEERLQEASPGYLYDVIVNGIGVMPDYDGQVRVPDRWAIVAYVKVLQLSQNATLDDVPAEMRGELGQ